MRIIPLLAFIALPGIALAQSTAFTYQGQLNDGGSPASGLHDFRFKLFDAATGGSQIGGIQCLDNLLVTEGRFTATIDFGNQFITPGARFIEMEVRRDTGLTCSNAGGFVTLAARQLITPAPLATHAKSAFSLDAANGSIANAVFVDNTGKVGIGTTTPTHSLHISGLEPTIALQDSDSTTNQVGYVSYRDSGGVERGWIGYGSPGDPDLTVLNARPAGDVVLNSLLGGIQLLGSNVTVNGNMGLGTSSPLAKLDVRGDIRLGPTGQLRAVSGQENLRIIRGKVNFDGQVLLGSGFTVTHSPGVYTLTFDTPFSSAPVITATADFSRNVCFGCAAVRSATSASATIWLKCIITDEVYDENFYFIAIGPR